MQSEASRTVFIYSLGVATGVILSILSFSVRAKKLEKEAIEVESLSNLNENHPAPRRFGSAIRLKREKYQKYRELHDNVWPEVLDRMRMSHIRNFTIYYHEETSTLFQHFEWTGHWNQRSKLTRAEEKQLFEADMKLIADHPITRSWWKECEPCQIPFSQWGEVGNKPFLSQGGKGDWWSPMECVAHCGHWATSYTSQWSDPDFLKLEESYKKTIMTP